MNKLYFLFLVFLGACATQKTVQNSQKESTQETQTGANTQKNIHLIMFATTEDKNQTIQNGSQANLTMVKQLAEDAKKNGFVLSITEKTGNAFNKQTLLSTISNLNSKESDVILFHFTGHGKASNNTDANKKKCPELYVTSATSSPPDWQKVTEDQLVNAYEIFDILSKRKHTLLVVFIESCADTAPSSSRTGGNIESPLRANNIKELFEDKDNILILSCEPKERSAINPNGGLATKAVINTINTQNFSGSWRGLFNIFKNQVITDSKQQQHPQLITKD